jgi:hypothetical protein
MGEWIWLGREILVERAEITECRTRSSSFYLGYHSFISSLPSLVIKHVDPICHPFFASRLIIVIIIIIAIIIVQLLSSLTVLLSTTTSKVQKPHCYASQTHFTASE